MDNLKRVLRGAFESKQRFTLLGQQYIYCDSGDDIEFTDDSEKFAVDGINDYVATATESGVFMLAVSIMNGKSGERPIRMMSSDDFMRHALEQVVDKKLTTSEVNDLAAELSLQYYDINVESRRMR